MLQSQISLPYTKGPTHSALNYSPSSVNNNSDTSMDVVLAKLILKAIQSPLDKYLSGHQYGIRKGCTPTKHAFNLLPHLSGTEDDYVCLLDIAKAFPIKARDSIHIALEMISTPQCLCTLVVGIYRAPQTSLNSTIAA